MKKGRRRVVGFALLLAISGWFVACTSVVTSPEELTDPVTVHLVFDDRHRGLAFPDGQGGYVEYGFGEWGWYAHEQDAWYHVFSTILWPTAGTLGRRETKVATAQALLTRYHWMRFEELEVERALLTTLRAELATQFAAHEADAVYNANYRMTFVPARYRDEMRRPVP